MRTCILILATVLMACGSTKPPPVTTQKVRGLVAEPARLPFTCVTPGCDTTLTTHVRVVGDRRIAIKRVILENDTNGEFTITPDQTPPFIIGASDSAFAIDVRYVPRGAPVASAVTILVTYTDSSPVETEDRVPPGQLAIPLVRRLVGEPVMVVTPTALSFGTVWQGQSKAMPVRVTNGGFGNVALELGGVDAGDPSVKGDLAGLMALVADAGFDLPLTFSPTTQMYLHSQVYLSPSSPDVEGVVVTVEGTSMNRPHLAIEPGGDIEFGEVPRNQTRSVSPTLVNQGGRDLVLSNLKLTDSSGMVSVTLPNNQTTLTMAPLARVPISFTLDAGVAGPVAASFDIDTNEFGRGTVQVAITATVTEPQLQVTPTHIDFGTVPQGWVVTQPIEIKNVGWGTLTIKNVLLVSGSSTLFTLKNLPAIPFTLGRDQRVAVDVEFRAETTATFSGSVSVESDDPTNSFIEAPLHAVGGSCTAGCPIAHGTPSCMSGSCDVGSCDVGWYNTDSQASNGCECAEVGVDPGAFCSDAVSKGNFKDSDGRRDTYTGIVPTDADVDLIRFHGEDASQFFSDDYNVRVSLASPDPNIMMCVYRHSTGSALSDCYYENESCGRSYQHDGSLGSSDDSDYVIKIFRAPGTAATCTTYTVFMQNG